MKKKKIVAKVIFKATVILNVKVMVIEIKLKNILIKKTVFERHHNQFQNI